ncbi:MAG: outer membrane beta-barrel protein [Gemmatimonadaceae bacterium]
MKRVVSLFAAVAMTVVMSASVAEAQSPIRFGIAGGLSLPTGEDKDLLENGFHGQVMLGFGMMALPVKLRADLSYHSFGGKDNILLGEVDARVIGGALNAILGMGGIGVKPYLTGGVGMYNSKREFSGRDDTATDFGLNGGVGLEFSLTGMSTFLEVRYVNIFTEVESTSVIPITFGILF